MATEPTKTNTPDNAPVAKNPAIVAAFAKARAAKQASPNYSQRELDNFKAMSPESQEKSGQYYDAEGRPTVKSQSIEDSERLDKARKNIRTQEKGRDIHIAAIQKGTDLPGTSRAEAGYNVPDAQRKPNPKMLEDVTSSKGFNETNAKRAVAGLPPLNVPNPDKQPMQPKTKLEAAMEGLKTPRPSFWDNAQTAQK